MTDKPETTTKEKPSLGQSGAARCYDQCMCRTVINRYREAIEILSYMGVFKDEEKLKTEIETGRFSDEYEITKQAAINASCGS